MRQRETYHKLPFSRRQALLSSVALSLIINSILVVCLVYMTFRLNTAAETFKWNEIVSYFILLFISNIALTYLLYNINYRIIRKYRRRRRVLSLVVLSTILICCLFSPVLSQIQWFFLDETQYENGFEAFVALNMVKDVLLGVLLLFEIGIRYTNYHREQTLIMNQKLIEENIRTRYEALKNQLDPHFLFNSLNTLNGLIGLDDEKAHDYVENLSSIFRYTLHSKTICKLWEEVEFTDSYISLLKIRYGKNLIVRYDIDSKYRDWYVMPISVQLLIENAIKHNTVSDKKPLFILIQTTVNDSLRVENMINPKLQSELSGGVGLSNLSDRYSILYGKVIDITVNDGVFAVEIPLINEKTINKLL